VLVDPHSFIIQGAHPSASIHLGVLPMRAQVVRASRNLPLALMRGEYERILRRRLAVVGGSPDDGALQEMLSSFRWAAIASGSPHREWLVSRLNTVTRVADRCLWFCAEAVAAADLAAGGIQSGRDLL